jgi:type IV pilus assembly protein PilB
VTTQDVTSPSESARLRTRREGRRHVLSGLLRALVQQQPPELAGLLEQSFARLRDLLPAAVVVFIELEGDPLEARFVCAAAQGAMADLLPRERFPASRLGFLGSQAWLRRAYRIEVVHSELPKPRILEAALGHPLQSVAAVPFLLGPARTGIVAALRIAGGAAFTEDDVELLERVADPLRSLFRRYHGLEGPLSEDERLRHVAALTGCPCVEIQSEVVDPQLLEALGGPALLRYEVLPLEDLGDSRIRAAVPNPLDWRTLGDFEAVSGYRISERCVAPAREIRDRLEASLEIAAKATEATQTPSDLLVELAEDLRGGGEASEVGVQSVDVSEHSPPVVRLCSQLIREASAMGASDIHVEARETNVAVRFRIDGVCRDRLTLPKHVARSLVARLKIMSDLDIAEHRLPQDGRLHFASFDPDLDIDLRVSVLPMLYGECVVMRLLDRGRTALPLESLGFSEHNLGLYREAIRSPFGMLLHCGPTGSGKSTTLYAALNEINDPQWKIVTVEDPIEFTLEGVNQLQVHRKIGLTFAAALRCFLRHDPDVILVGEIRDSETARIATEAALTGHLLLSTLHTNDAATSVARLERLGIEPFLIANTVIAICAQRLVRRVCSCGLTREPSAQALSLLRRARDGRPPSLAPVALGCERCRHTGYRGRTGVHELMVIGSRLRQHISDRASSDVLKLAAHKQGMRTMFEDSMAKVNAGATPLEEALRVCRADELA